MTNIFSIILNKNSFNLKLFIIKDHHISKIEKDLNANVERQCIFKIRIKKGIKYKKVFKNILITEEIKSGLWLKHNVFSILQSSIIEGLMWVKKCAKIISTVGENIIATNKKPNNFCYPLKIVIFTILR